MAKLELAGRIVIDTANQTLTIDGVEFPWYIAAGGVQANHLGARDFIPSVTVEILATSVEVIPSDA
jgi:hypothetical protein